MGSADAPPVGSDGSTIDALTADQACATIATERCQKLMSCSPADLEKRFGDLTTCETRQKLDCTLALAAPDTGNTPSDIIACGFAVEQEACADFLQKAPPNACLKQMGTLSGACAFQAQCTTAFCQISDTELCGTCTAEPTAGATCGNGAGGCGQELVCTAAGTCEVPRQATQACDKNQPCANGLTCVGATATASGACMAQAANAGDACDPTHKTGVDCNDDAGLTCNTTTLKCVQQPIASATQACGVTNGVRTACSAGSSCQIPTGMTTGTCVAPAADNAACDTAAGPSCFFPAKCIITGGTGTAGTCELPGSMTCS